MPKNKRVIIKVSTTGKVGSSLNYSRRMYAIIRRYTPSAVESNKNECLAEITGLRTFFKGTYKDLANKIVRDLRNELGLNFNIKVGSPIIFDLKVKNGRKEKNVSTYKEMNKIFFGKKVDQTMDLRDRLKVKKLIVPFIGIVK